MKKLILALAIALPMFLQAQQGKSCFSMECHTGFGISYCRAFSTQDPPIGTAATIGLNGKFDLNMNWSLMVGLDYQYHNNVERYNITVNDLQGNMIEDLAICDIRSHHYRLPVLVEYHANWFYVAFGLYYETCVYDSFRSHYFACGGACFDIGGRIKLSENNRLRIGISPTLGVIYSPEIYSFSFEWECTSIASVGFEHRF